MGMQKLTKILKQKYPLQLANDQGMLLDQIGTMIVEDGIIKIRDMDGNYLTAE